MSKRVPRLQFTDEELKASKVKKAAKKADKAVDKLEKAEKKIPKKIFHEDVDKPKPSSKLTSEVKKAPVNVASATVHKKISETEDENVGVESVHKIEQGVEGAVRTGNRIERSRKLKPYRETARAEKKADKANVDALFKQSQEQTPQFSSNPYSRWQQKRAIKKDYAAMKTAHKGATASQSASASAKTAQKSKEAAKKVKDFVESKKRRP